MFLRNWYLSTKERESASEKEMDDLSCLLIGGDCGKAKKGGKSWCRLIGINSLLSKKKAVYSDSDCFNLIGTIVGILNLLS